MFYTLELCQPNIYSLTLVLLGEIDLKKNTAWEGVSNFPLPGEGDDMNLGKSFARRYEQKCLLLTF